MIVHIIGTDTSIGKTYVSCNILQYLGNSGIKAIGLKPIASGISNINGNLINEDAYKLWQESYTVVTLDMVNPICFTEAIAPHIAAKNEAFNLDVDTVISKTNIVLANHDVDTIIVEGVGGLMTPLNQTQTYLDLLLQWQHHVILIAGMKLGCLNHSLLTHNTLINHNITVIGFIANQIDESMLYFTENLDYLQKKLNIPLLGYCGFQQKLQTTTFFTEIFKC